jgi:hypothetical protein
MRSIKTYFLFGIVTVFLLSSCGLGNKLASSFGKRKYTKGYYIDMPSSNEYCSSASKVDKISLFLNPLPVLYKLPKLNQSNYSASVKISERPIPRIVNKLAITLNEENKPVQDVANSAATDKIKDVNFVAVAGLAVCIAAATVAIIAKSFTPLAFVLAGIGIVICIISFFQHKVYWNWLGALGLFILIIMVTLIVV